MRASGVFTEGPRRHTIHLIGRGRDTRRMFGGGDLEPVGKATLGVFTPIPRPNFVYSGSNHDHIEQETGGIGYEGLWSSVGELSFGLQKNPLSAKLQQARAHAHHLQEQPLAL